MAKNAAINVSFLFKLFLFFVFCFKCDLEAFNLGAFFFMH